MEIAKASVSANSRDSTLRGHPDSCCHNNHATQIEDLEDVYQVNTVDAVHEFGLQTDGTHAMTSYSDFLSCSEERKKQS